MDARVVDRTSAAYKLKYHEAGKSFMGGGKKMSREGMKRMGKLFGESPNLRKK